MRNRIFTDSPNLKSSLFPLTRQSLLVRLYNLRDNDAWSQFFEIYSAVIFQMGRKKGLHDHDAEEAVAVVMRNLAQSFRSGHTVKGRLRHYLRTIANHQITRQLKGNDNAASLEAIHELAVDDALPDEEWSRIEDQERLRACLDRVRSSPAIRPRDFAAFEYWVIQGVPVKSVAKRFGITPNRVHGIKHKIIKALKETKLRLDIELGEV